MSNVLTRKVFVLNKFWKLVNEVTVQDAIKQMVTDVATALDFSGDMYMPVKWADWVKLAPFSEEETIHTLTAKIRMPTVIVAVNYDKVHPRRKKVSVKTIAERDGNRDYVTNEILKPHEMSIDHLDPISRGGSKTDPRNMALLRKDRNNKKGAKTPEEMGWTRPKTKPLGMVVPKPSHPHHEHFVTKS